MIVHPQDGELLLVTQEDHARLTGDLAAALPFAVGHHAAFVAAARLHDNGWREADATPTADGDGRPHTFTTVPDPTYEAVWRRGIERAAALDDLLGLLVGLHGARFFETRESPGMRELVAQERRRQNAVLSRLGLGGSWEDLPDTVAQASAWIALLDALSLLLCGAALPDRLEPTVDDTHYVLQRGGLGRAAVAPWPFGDDPLRLEVPARRVPDEPYDTDSLRAALAAARFRPLAVEVTADGAAAGPAA